MKKKNIIQNKDFPVIDVHTHLFPDRLYRAIWGWFEEHGWHVRYQIYADEVVRLLKKQGIKRLVALNYSHKPGMSESLNDWTYKFCKKYPEIIPFGAIHPDDNHVRRLLDRCFDKYHFYGIKFHTHVTGIRPDDPKMFPIYEKLIEYDRVITLHAGIGPSLDGYEKKTMAVSGAKFVAAVLKKFPKLKIILPHLGADEIDAFFDLMSEFPNLWMDTTMALSGYFPLKIPWDKIEKFSDRLLYGSDFPNLPYEMSTEIDRIRSSRLSPKAQENIFFNNAKRLFGIDS